MGLPAKGQAWPREQRNHALRPRAPSRNVYVGMKSERGVGTPDGHFVPTYTFRGDGAERPDGAVAETPVGAQQAQKCEPLHPH